MKSLVLTIIGADRIGLLNLLAHRVAAFHGNWLESRLAHLSGQFAGILHVQVAQAHAEELIAALRDLETQGLHVVVAESELARAGKNARTLKLDLVGQDRPGIVRDISHLLAQQGASIEEFSSECVSSSFSGENLFKAEAQLRVPTTMATDALRKLLEGLANELMVDVSLDESKPT